MIALVEESFGDWRMVGEHQELLSSEAARVRVLVHNRSAPRDGFLPTFLSDENFILASGSFALVEPAMRNAVALVTPDEVANHAQFRYTILEAMTFGILTTLDRQPLHAAAVSLNDRMLLLAGRSGLGKSTLAYALGRSGFKVMTDDSVYLQRRPRLRAWGMPRYLHISEESRRFFPELSAVAAQLSARGKNKIVIDTRALGISHELPVGNDPRIVVLARANGPARLERLTPAQVVHALTTDMEQGFDRFQETIAPLLEQLAANAGWKLHLSDDPADAVTLLKNLANE